MFSQETVGLAGNVTFGLAVIVILIYLLLNAKDAAVHLIVFFIIALPLMNSPYLPGNVFGIRGLSPVNFITALACLAIFAKLFFSGRIYGYLLRFLNWPLVICMVVFVFSSGVTYFASNDHLYYQGGSSITSYTASRADFLINEVIRPVQVILVGFLVMVTCDIQGNKRLVQRALLIAPIALSTIALLFSLSAGLESYKESREALGNLMGLHGNGFGALSVYFLVAAVTMREHDWPWIRYMAIAFSLLGVVLSYSRIAFIASVLMLALLYFQLPAKEKVLVGSLCLVVIVLFSGQLIERIYYGMAEGLPQTDMNTISAGRTEDIWMPGIRQVMEKPIFGYGIGMLVDSPTSGRINPHNGFLQVLLNSGLIGILAVANLFFWAFRYCRKRNDEIFFLLLAMLIMALTGHNFYPDRSNYVVWILYGMMLHSRYRAAPAIEPAITSTAATDIRHQRKPLAS